MAKKRVKRASKDRTKARIANLRKRHAELVNRAAQVTIQIEELEAFGSDDNRRLVSNVKRLSSKLEELREKAKDRGLEVE